MPKHNRTSEHEIALAVLRYLATVPGGEATVTAIKKNVPNFIKLTADDLQPSGTRPNEMVYQQVIGNIVSHRHDSEDNFVNRGLLSYRPRHLKITDAGRNYLKKRG